MLYFNSSFASKSISYTCIAKIHSVIGTHSVKFANQRTRRSMSTLYQPVNYQCYENSGLNFLKLCKKTDCREISNVPTAKPMLIPGWVNLRIICPGYKLLPVTYINAINAQKHQNPAFTLACTIPFNIPDERN